MKKIIFTIILCCSCVLNAGWFGLTKDKTTAELLTEKIENEKRLENEKIENEKRLEIERIETEKKIKICKENLSKDLATFENISKKYYFLQNTDEEENILKQYKGIAINESLLRLTQTDSLMEYMQIILSEIRKTKKELEQNKISIEEFSKKINGLIFAWTVPYEILSTKNIFDHSITGLAPLVYKNINKKTYNNYENFIKEIRIKLLPDIVFFIENAYESTEKVCYTDNEFNLSGYYDSNIYTNGRTSLFNEKGHMSIIFNRIENSNDESVGTIDKAKIKVLNNPFNDEWYMMIREYIKIQDRFYKIKKEINKIIDSLSKVDNAEKIVVKMEENLILSDSLYRKLDALVRYNVIGLPLAIYSDIYTFEIRNAQGIFNDDEEKIAEIALKYNQTCANMQKYVSSEFTRNKFLQVVKLIKKELKDEEYQEIVTSAKLSQDWLNMLNKVKVENK